MKFVTYGMFVLILFAISSFVTWSEIIPDASYALVFAVAGSLTTLAQAVSLHLIKSLNDIDFSGLFSRRADRDLSQLITSKLDALTVRLPLGVGCGVLTVCMAALLNFGPFRFFVLSLGLTFFQISAVSMIVTYIDLRNVLKLQNDIKIKRNEKEATDKALGALSSNGFSSKTTS